MAETPNEKINVLLNFLIPMSEETRLHSAGIDGVSGLSEISQSSYDVG